MVKFQFKAIEVNGSTDRIEHKFSLEFAESITHGSGFQLMDHARHWCINHMDMSKAWTVERDYHTERRQA